MNTICVLVNVLRKQPNPKDFSDNCLAKFIDTIHYVDIENTDLPDEDEVNTCLTFTKGCLLFR